MTASQSDLHDSIADQCQAQIDEQQLQLQSGADLVRVGEHDNVAERLPHAVVGERRLFFVSEHKPVERFSIYA